MFSECGCVERFEESPLTMHLPGPCSPLLGSQLGDLGKEDLNHCVLEIHLGRCERSYTSIYS